jgi:TetR/AcrR family transcriptional regulator
MGEVRDANRTRKKIMQAARDEFAARGFAGARMESIGQRAGLAKQLLYHYFASKEVLFEETLKSKYEQHRAGLADTAGAGALFVQRFRIAADDPDWIRFITWEAAEHQESGRITAEASRREAIARLASAIAARQTDGELAADLPTDLLQLAIYALAVYPVAFPQMTQMVTGRVPDDPGFQADWTAFLEEIARRVAGPQLTACKIKDQT